jgi:hypothetical protein
MTEGEWLACQDAGQLLAQVLRQLSDRKLRLFVSAFWFWQAGNLKKAEFRADVVRRTAAMERWAETEKLPRPFRRSHSQRVIFFGDASSAASLTVRAPSMWGKEAKRHCEESQLLLLRDIVGNPFHAVTVASAVLMWNDGTIRRIAEGIYDERAFDRLPILHDALLDAGCDDEAILSHCRSAGPHVRGCWVIDLILGKS